MGSHSEKKIDKYGRLGLDIGNMTDEKNVAYGQSVQRSQEILRIWTGNGLIYGKMRGRGGAKSQSVSAHRMSYELHYGQIPEGLCVLHRCDTPKCVNPGHLFLGTHQDNTDDMYSKGRQSKYVPEPKKGESNRNSKVTVKDVLAIRADKRPYKEIAKQYGIAVSTAKTIRNKRSWKWL